MEDGLPTFSIRPVHVDDASDNDVAVDERRVTREVAAQVRSNLIAGLKKPRFEGQAHQWETFKCEWKQYWEIFENSGGKTVRKFQLEHFKDALDQNTQRILAYEKERNPKLGFWDFWAKLDDMYRMDYATQYQEKWRQVKLQYKGSKVNLHEWRKFRTFFEQAKHRVVDPTPDEERTLIMNQLPPDLVSEVVKEEFKSMDKHKLAVRVRKTPGLDRAGLSLTLTRLWGLDHAQPNHLLHVWNSIQDDPHGWVVKCYSKQPKHAHLDIGWSLVVVQ